MLLPDKAQNPSQQHTMIFRADDPLECFSANKSGGLPDVCGELLANVTTRASAFSQSLALRALQNVSRIPEDWDRTT